MNAPVSRHPVWAVADVAAVLLLLALAVVGLASTFVGWGFLLLAQIAAGLAVLVVLATLRLPVIALVAAGTLAGILLARPVALRSGGFGGGVPDAQTLADVMKGSWTGWGELLTTLPRVDLSGPPTLVPFLLGYLGRLLACALALRSRSAAAPVLPLLGVLVGVLLLRLPATGLLEWHAVAFAVLGLAWVPSGDWVSPRRRGSKSGVGRVVAWPGGQQRYSSWRRHCWSPYPSPQAVPPGPVVPGARHSGDDSVRCRPCRTWNRRCAASARTQSSPPAPSRTCTTRCCWTWRALRRDPGMDPRPRHDGGHYR